jgi:hypothetical protein
MDDTENRHDILIFVKSIDDDERRDDADADRRAEDRPKTAARRCSASRR